MGHHLTRLQRERLRRNPTARAAFLARAVATARRHGLDLTTERAADLLNDLLAVSDPPAPITHAPGSDTPRCGETGAIFMSGCCKC
jgi:hypothetical protein